MSPEITNPGTARLITANRKGFVRPSEIREQGKLALSKVVITVCTFHLIDRQEEVPGETHELRIDGVDRTIDACPSCYEERLAPVKTLVDQYGEKPARTRRRGAPRKTATASATARPRKATTAAAPGRHEAALNANDKYECSCGREFDRPQAIGRHQTSTGHPPKKTRRKKQTA